MNTQEKIREILEKEFSPLILEIQDDSALHAGHKESLRSGGGHFSVLIVSERFIGLKLIARHRLIYEALGKKLKKDIHALAIKALVPAEYSI